MEIKLSNGLIWQVDELTMRLEDTPDVGPVEGRGTVVTIAGREISNVKMIELKMVQGTSCSALVELYR